MRWVLFTPRFPWLQFVCQFLLGASTASLNVIPNAMVADICDLDELKTGDRREGAFNGILSLMLKAGFAGTFFITGLLLKLSGFEENLDVQAPDTVQNMRLLLVVVPVALGIVIALLSGLYPLREDMVKEARLAVENRRRKRELTENGRPENVAMQDGTTS